MPHWYMFSWVQVQVLANGLFLGELLSDFFINGVLETLRDKSRTRVEFVC